MLNTLGNNRFVHKGSQWALHNATDVDVDVYEGARWVYGSPN